MLTCESIGLAMLHIVHNLALSLHPVLPLHFPVKIKNTGRAEASIFSLFVVHISSWALGVFFPNVGSCPRPLVGQGWPSPLVLWSGPLVLWSLVPWSIPSGLFLALPRVTRVAGHRLLPVKSWGCSNRNRQMRGRA